MLGPILRTWRLGLLLPCKRSSCSLYTVGDQLGRVVLGGGCLFGISSLCYYGLGLSGEAGAIDRAG